MSRDWQQLFGALVGACLVLASCTGTSPCAKGAKATFDLHALDDSTAIWTIGQSPLQTSSGFVAGAPLLGQCNFIYQGVVYESGMRLAIPGIVAFGCVGEGQQEFDFLGLDLGDPRDWSVGTFTLQDKKCATECSSCAPAPGPTGKSCLYGTLDSVSVKVDVEIATGSAAPIPKLVTDDFVRTFRVEFDTSGATARTPQGEVCDFPVSEKASLHLTQTAADYTYDANPPCPG